MPAIKIVLACRIVGNCAALVAIHKLAETPGAAHIILRTRSVNGRKPAVTIEIHFHFPLAPPATAIGGVGIQPDTHAEKTAPSGYPRQDFKIIAGLAGPAARPRSMKIERIRRYRLQRKIDIVKEFSRFTSFVDQQHFCVAAKRHGYIAIEGTAFTTGKKFRLKSDFAAQVVAKEITQRHVHGRLRRIIPEHLEPEAAELTGRLINGQPDSLNHSLSLYRQQALDLAGFEVFKSIPLRRFIRLSAFTGQAIGVFKRTEPALHAFG